MSRNTLIRGWLDGKLSRRREEALWEKVRQDPVVRRDLEATLRLESMLCGYEAGEISHLELERIEERVLRSVDGTAPAEPHTVKSWVIAFSAATAALLLLPMLWWLKDSRPSEVRRGDIPAELFAPRGSAAPYETHLFVFCVDDRDADVAAHRLDRPGGDAAADQCPLQAELQFAFTNLGETYSYLYVFGVDDTGRRLWYFPKPVQGESLALQTEVSEVLLGDSIILDVNHRAGSVRVAAVFSSEPLRDDEIADAATALRDPAAVPGELLDGTGRYVESFVMKIIDEGDAP